MLLSGTRRAASHHWQLPSSLSVLSIAAGHITAHSCPCVCVSVSIVMASHYAEHIHFWQQNKRPAFIFLRMFTVWVNGALFRAIQMTSQSCPLYTGSMGCCVQTAWPLKARGLPDDGVTETSAMEVQMVALGTLHAVEAEKYDFNLSKLYWLGRLQQ